MSEPTTAATTYSPCIESDLRAGAKQLRAAMDDHGYLFFRALVPVDEADAEWQPVRQVLDRVPGAHLAGDEQLVVDQDRLAGLLDLLPTVRFTLFRLYLGIRTADETALGMTVFHRPHQ